MSDEPPVISRSPRGTIIVRVKRSVQVAAARVVLGPVIKLAVAGVAVLVASIGWAWC